MDDEQTPIWNGPMLNALCCVWHGLSSTNSDQTMLATPAGPSVVDRKLQGLWHPPPSDQCDKHCGPGEELGLQHTKSKQIPRPHCHGGTKHTVPLFPQR